jgi:Carboxypeptidase regulatory-like domain
MRSLLVAAAVVAGALLLVVPGTGCGSNNAIPSNAIGSLEGVVSDESGAPLAGVTVRLGEATYVTKADGTFGIANLRGGESYELTFTKPGYQTVTQHVVIGDGRSTVTITMQRAAAP